MGVRNNSKLEERYSNVDFTLNANRLGINGIRFEFGDSYRARFTTSVGTYELELGFEKWIYGVTSVKTEETNTDYSIISEHVTAKYVWNKDQL